MVRTYLLLTKPGIVLSNVMVAVGAFFLAANGHIELFILFSVLFGLAGVIASACVFNNYIDRNIDAKMSRTKNRALASGKISARKALTYAVALLVAGTFLLARYTNPTATYTALTGFVFYVAVYGYWKRKAPIGTVIGSISGAIPPVVGYSAVTGRIDSGAIILFLILVMWQMPHFYAIAIYRLKDYANAGIPVLPVKKGMLNTKINMLLYVAGFIVVSVLLSLYGYTGYTYLVVMLLLGMSWLRLAIRGFKTADDNRWAKKLFGFSIIILTAFSVLIAFNRWLP